MQAEIAEFVRTLMAILWIGAALFLLRYALAWLLRKRVPKGLVPTRLELQHPDSLARIAALIGHGAPVAETLGTRRLRATLGMRAVWWLGFGAVSAAALSVNPPLFGIETAMILVVGYTALHTTFYEIVYDRETISLPRWWFGRTTRKWRDLDAVVDRRGWTLDFHFRDGTRVQAHKYVVGYGALREKAEAILREV